MKYSRTAIGLLTAQYRSVLKKCFLINMGLFALGAAATPANAETVNINETVWVADGATQNIGSAGDTVNISTNSDGVVSIRNGSIVNITGDEINITTKYSGEGSGGLWAQNSTDTGAENVATINVTGGDINIQAPNALGVVAMSEGVVNITGNTTINAVDAIVARGHAQVNINKNNTTNKTVMDGNINFNYDKATSGTVVDAYVDVTLNGSESRWTGNTIASYGSGEPPSPDYLKVSSSSLTLNNGAVWNATVIADNSGDLEGKAYAGLNNLNVNKGTVNVADQTRGIYVDNLVASDLTVNGGVMNVTKSIDTINDVIDNYVNVKLADGVEIKGDIDFASGEADLYGAADGTTAVTYTVANALGADIQYGETKDIQVVDGAVTVNKSGSFAWYDSNKGLTLASSGTNDGKVKVTGTAGGIDAAADASTDNTNIEYSVTADETLTVAKEIKGSFELTGQGQDATDPALTLNANLSTAAGANVSITDAKLEGTGTFQNVAGATTTVNNSNIDVAVNNAGIMYSDPTYYTKQVVNTGIATFDGDTFDTGSSLENNATVNLKGGTTFVSGVAITGAGDLNLVSDTTHFNNTSNENDVYLANGAKFDGTLVGGSLDTSNNNIENGTNSLGSVSGVDLYIDASLAGTGSVDTFADATGSTIKEINIVGNNYGTNGSVTLAVGSGAALDENVQINGANYYTDMAISGGTITLSNKLINSSALNAQLGTWSAGSNIAASNTYNTTTNSYSTGGQTVGTALTALDTAIGDVNYANEAAVTGSVLKTGTGATTTVRGALDALDGGKQNKLTSSSGNAGNGITITDAGLISAKAGDTTITVDTAGIKVGTIQTANIADDAVTLDKIADAAMTSAAVAANSTGTKLVNETSLALTRQAMDTDASGVLGGVYAVNGSTKVVSYDATALTDNMYKANGTGAASTSLTNALNNMATNVGAMTGTSINASGAVVADYSSNYYVTDNAPLLASVGALDTALHNTDTIVGPAQTAASGTGQFATRKIGDDINLVNAVDELGQNMVSLSADNVFTGLNTFKNDGGIALQDSAGANSTRIKATANGLNIDRTVEATGFKMSGSANTVTSIDVDGTGVTSAAAAQNIMATAATVYEGAEKGEYTGAKVTGDTATSHTLNTALAKTNTTLNNVLTTAGTEVDSAKVDVQWNSTDSTLSTVLGNGVYASTTNYVTNGSSVTAAVGALDGALGAKVTGTNGNVLNTNSVNANLDKIDVNMGKLSSLTTTAQTSLVDAINEVDANADLANNTIGAGTLGSGTGQIAGVAGDLNGKTIGTTYTVTQAIADLNATNQNQNGSLSSLATLINGQTVGADGNLTGTATALDTAFGAGANLTSAANTLLTDITVTTAGTNIAAGANVAGNLTALDTTIGDVDYSNESAVAGSVLKKGAGSTTTVRGALDALDGAIASSDAKAVSLGNAIGGTWSGDAFTHSDYNAANKNIANADSLTTAIGKLDTAIGKVATGTYNAISATNDVATNLQALDAAFTSGTIDAVFDDTTVKTLKIGTATAISASGTTLDFAKNSLTNVQGLTLTDASGNTGTLSADASGISTNTNLDVNGTLTVGSSNQFVVDNSGNVTTSGNITTTGDVSANDGTFSGNLGVTGNTTIGGTLGVTGAATVGSLNIGSTGKGINSTGDATLNSLNVAGKGFDSSGNATTGTLKIGDAAVITGTTTGGASKLDMGGNDLTNIDDFSMTGNATIGGTLSAGATTIAASGAGTTTALNVTATDTSGSGSTTTFTVASDKASVGGNLDVSGTLGVGANAKVSEDDAINFLGYGESTPETGQKVLEVNGVNAMAVAGTVAATNGFSVVTKTGSTYAEVFGIDDKGSIKSDMLKVDNSSTGNTITLGKNASTATDIKGNLTLNSTGAATDPYVNAIDDGTTAATSAGTNNAHTVATLASVLTSAENGAYTGDSDKNITAGSTIKTAINALDSEIGADTDYSLTQNGVAGTNTVKKNIDNVNKALGDVSTVAVNGYAPTAPATKNLTDAVTALNTNMNNVLGAIYKSDGTYDASQLIGDGFSAAGTGATANLTQSLKDYAANVETATGGTFANTGVWTGSIDGKVDDGTGTATLVDRAVAYGTITDANIMDVVDQLYANVGNVAITGVDRSATLATATTAGTKTVNANIDALDAAIGNLNYTGGTINYALANGSATDGIKTIVANIGAATTAANGNITSTKSVNANLDQLDASIGDRSAIGSKNAAINAGTAANVAAGLKAAGDAIGDMNFARAHYVGGSNDLSSAVRTLDDNLYRVETDLHDVKRDLNRGMASMAAMSALVPNPRAHGNTSLAIGTGAYSGHTAAAIGGFHYLTDNIMLNAGAAWGNSRDASYRLGVTVSW